MYTIYLLILIILVSGLIPKKYDGVIVFDIDNTLLCNGSMMGNSKCIKDFYSLSPTNPCSDKEIIYSQKSPQIKYGAEQSEYDGRCLKEEGKDGRDISCSIHRFNYQKVSNFSCDPTLDPITGFPKGIDCDTQKRVQKLIKSCRDKNYAVAINTSEFKDDVINRIGYLKTLGFTEEELKFIEDGGVITYNISKSTDMYSQAKQKAINMIALGEKFGLSNDELILIDDQMSNCKAVRDLGFRSYNVSTTFGEMYGWGCGSDTTCQCGITDSQTIEILNML